MEKSIRSWMSANSKRFIDACGEFDFTACVETWDVETQDGLQTLDPDHVAWDIAIGVGEKAVSKAA